MSNSWNSCQFHVQLNSGSNEMKLYIETSVSGIVMWTVPMIVSVNELSMLGPISCTTRQENKVNLNTGTSLPNNGYISVLFPIQV